MTRDKEQIQLRSGQIVRHDIAIDYDTSGDTFLVVSIAFAILIIMYLWSVRK